MFDLPLNPFLWQGVVFAVFGVLVGLAVNSVTALPKRIIEAL